MGNPVELARREQGHGEAVVILHGLFGSGTNWRGVARLLQERYRVVTVDLRNHGRSPNVPGMRYTDMAGDVLGLLDELALESPVLVGHSMGGKAAMTLALENPSRLRALVVVDIAPVAYGYGDEHRGYIRALERLDTAGVASRAEADERLAAEVPDRGVRQFLLQNLVYDNGTYRVRLGLDAIDADMDAILGFDPPAGVDPWEGPALFIAGGESPYLAARHHEAVRKWFPHARIETVAGAGHWVHAQAPQEVSALISAFAPAAGAGGSR